MGTRKVGARWRGGDGRSETAQAETAIDMKDFPGGEGKAPEARAATAGRRRRESPSGGSARGPSAIRSLYARGPGESCRSRSSRDGSRGRWIPVLREPDGEELGDHAQPGLGDAVFAARLTLAKLLEIEVMKTICGLATIPALDQLDHGAGPRPGSGRTGLGGWSRRTRSQLSGVVSSRSRRRSGATPALFTQTSTRPKASRTSSTRRTSLARGRRRRPGSPAARGAPGPRPGAARDRGGLGDRIGS